MLCFCVFCVWFLLVGYRKQHCIIVYDLSYKQHLGTNGFEVSTFVNIRFYLDGKAHGLNETYKLILRAVFPTTLNEPRLSGIKPHAH